MKKAVVEKKKWVQDSTYAIFLLSSTTRPIRDLNLLADVQQAGYVNEKHIS